MKNPYERLFIYYLDGVPAMDRGIEVHGAFLGTWIEEKEAFLFFASPCDGLVDRITAASPGIRLIEKYEMTGEEWHGDKIEPYHIHDLCIFPPWKRPDKTDEKTKEVLLDPGVVFGTGRHQTTEDCLVLIHRLCSKEMIGTVLDIGTGTGLLALGAAALGCRRVLACDFNFLAVKTARDNIRLNRVEGRVLAFQARGEDMMPIPCDLLVANIHYDVMRHLIESPHLLEKKWIILSGLLNSEAKKVLDLLCAKSVHIVERRCPDGIWNTLLARPLQTI